MKALTAVARLVNEEAQVGLLGAKGEVVLLQLRKRHRLRLDRVKLAIVFLETPDLHGVCLASERKEPTLRCCLMSSLILETKRTF